jgi:hypothetical protein
LAQKNITNQPTHTTQHNTTQHTANTAQSETNLW